MTDTPAIRRAAGDEDVAYAADLIARSFDHLGANRYLVPDDGERLPIMRQFFHLHADNAHRGAGQVFLTDGAAAVWFDNTGESSPPADYDQRLAAITGKHIDRFLELGKMFDTYHPTEPHWHLAFLAVETHRQGHGLGSALMNLTHARLDDDGVDAYLEASDLNSRRLYRRHGYTDMKPPQMVLGDGTPFYRMWRPARPQ